MRFAAFLFQARLVPGRESSRVEKKEKKVGRDGGKRMRTIAGGAEYKVTTAPVVLLYVSNVCADT